MNPTIKHISLCILQGQWPAVQVLIFALSSLRDAEFLIEFSRNSIIWEQEKKDFLSRDK